MENLGSYNAVACTWLQQKHYLKTHIFHTKIKLGSSQHTLISKDEEDSEFMYFFVEPVSNGFCLKFTSRVSPSLSLLRTQGANMEVCCIMEDVFPNGVFQVLWASSTPSSVLLHGNNATWVEFAFQPEAPPPLVSIWEGIIVPNTYNVFSRCLHCPLVVFMPKRMDKQNLWEINFLELSRSSSAVSRYIARIAFIPDSVVLGNPFFKVNKIHVDCNSAHGNSIHRDCIAKDHSIFIQFGYGIVNFTIERSVHGIDNKYKVSAPTHVFCPFDDPSFYGAVLPTGSFSLSQNGMLLALMITTSLNKVHSHIWNLESGLSLHQEVVVGGDEPLKIVDCIAIGDIYYTVLMSDGRTARVAIIETASGNEVVQVEFPKLSQSSLSADSCACEKWMNTLLFCDYSRLVCLALHQEATLITVAMVTTKK